VQGVSTTSEETRDQMAQSVLRSGADVMRFGR
jgi:hypothetical protein